MKVVTVEMIRAVRKGVERSVAECRAALESTGGDVTAAIESILTPEERNRNHKAAIFTPPARVEPAAEAPRFPPVPPPPPDGDGGIGELLAQLDTWWAACRAARSPVWVGEPDATALAALVRAYEAEWRTPFPGSLRELLSRWNGFEPDPSSVIWGCTGHDRDAVAEHDAPECARAYAIGEARDSGYLFLLVDGTLEPPVYFFDYGDPPPVFRVADGLTSFLRDWMAASFDLLQLVARARDRHAGGP
jgi:hypothetical protein